MTLQLPVCKLVGVISTVDIELHCGGCISETAGDGSDLFCVV